MPANLGGGFMGDYGDDVIGAGLVQQQSLAMANAQYPLDPPNWLATGLNVAQALTSILPGGPVIGAALGAVEGAIGGDGASPAVRGGRRGAAAPVKTWKTGTATFTLYSDGWVGTIKKNGIFKSWRPYRPVALGKRLPTKAQWKRINHRLHDWSSVARGILRREGYQLSKGGGGSRWRSSQVRRRRRSR